MWVQNYECLTGNNFSDCLCAIISRCKQYCANQYSQSKKGRQKRNPSIWGQLSTLPGCTYPSKKFDIWSRQVLLYVIVSISFSPDNKTSVHISCRYILNPTANIDVDTVHTANNRYADTLSVQSPMLFLPCYVTINTACNLAGKKRGFTCANSLMLSSHCAITPPWPHLILWTKTHVVEMLIWWKC